MANQPKNEEPRWAAEMWDAVLYDGIGEDVELENGAEGTIIAVTANDKLRWPELAQEKVLQICLWEDVNGGRHAETSTWPQSCYMCRAPWSNHAVDVAGRLICP